MSWEFNAARKRWDHLIDSLAGPMPEAEKTAMNVLMSLCDRGDWARLAGDGKNDCCQ
jgi:hypothetical protein